MGKPASPIGIGALFDCWWRLDRYEVDGGYVQPAEGANLEKYNPWADYYREPGPRRQGGEILLRSYLSLVDLVDILVGPHAEFRKRQATEAQQPANLEEWCSRYGLLGTFFFENRHIVIHPRWELEQSPFGKGGQVLPSHHTFSQDWTGTRWIEAINQNGFIAEIFHLSPREKPLGELVPPNYWLDTWEKPGVVTYDAKSGMFYRRILTEVMKRFFPRLAASLSDSELETFRYPRPMSDQFWHIYGESVSDFLAQATLFRNSILDIANASREAQISEEKQRLLENGRDQLRYFAFQSGPSLMASYALMAILDFERGLLNVCDNCERIFASSAGRPRFCSAQCRKKILQQEYRARRPRNHLKTGHR